MAEIILISRDDSKLSAELTGDGYRWKARVLEAAALIGRVSCAEEQQIAVNADKAITEYVNEVEKSRIEIKEPILLCSRKIDALAKDASADPIAERNRIRKLIADFAALELKKVLAAQAAENERLTALERDRQKALSECTSHEKLDAINEEFDIRTREEARAPVAPVRAQGQIAKEDWEFEVRDVWALARAHPNCVKPPEVRRLEVKSLLDAGVKVVGVRAWREIRSSVRLDTKGALQIQSKQSRWRGSPLSPDAL